MPPANDILAATGAGRSRAYELAKRLKQLLRTFVQAPGRPRAVVPESTTIEADTGDSVSRAVLNFLLRHPGCAKVGDERCNYSDAFRAFILELRQRHSHLATKAFAQQCAVPWGTLKDWLGPGKKQQASGETSVHTNQLPTTQPKIQSANAATKQSTVTAARMATVVAEWNRWAGTFTAFVQHLQRDLRVPMGQQLISSILQANGLRTPKRRKGRSPDEIALRSAFDTFFPNAQWVGDGKTVVVQINGQPIALNLELNVDAYSGAWVGLSIRDEEDSQAVIEAFRQGVETTGEPPMAELLDNKAANHSPDVDAELENAGTAKIRATLGRPQNKGHVEGAFGLFVQTAPQLLLDTTKGVTETAKQLLTLIATTIARVLNRRPRRDRGGASRHELHQRKPTDEEHRAAKEALEERARRQELARQTAEMRQRPEVRAFLDEQFEALALHDPKRSHRLALARYPLEILCDAFAIFKAKNAAGSIPKDCDPPRYLLGIAKNIMAKREAEYLTKYLYDLRCKAQDHVLAVLTQQQQELLVRSTDPVDTITAYVRNALDATRSIDRSFWLEAAKTFLQSQAEQAHALYLRVAVIVHTAFTVPVEIRQDIQLALAEGLVPLT